MGEKKSKREGVRNGKSQKTSGQYDSQEQTHTHSLALSEREKHKAGEAFLSRCNKPTQVVHCSFKKKHAGKSSFSNPPLQKKKKKTEGRRAIKNRHASKEEKKKTVDPTRYRE
jgi:hypothetical protein